MFREAQTGWCVGISIAPEFISRRSFTSQILTSELTLKEEKKTLTEPRKQSSPVCHLRRIVRTRWTEGSKTMAGLNKQCSALCMLKVEFPEGKAPPSSSLLACFVSAPQHSKGRHRGSSPFKAPEVCTVLRFLGAEFYCGLFTNIQFGRVPRERARERE